MEFTLVAVTVLSLLIAIAMGAVTWRVVHEERRRSAARLAALAEELRRNGVRAPESPDADADAGPTFDSTHPATGEWDFDPPPDQLSAQRVDKEDERLDAFAGGDSVAGDLFGRPAGSPVTPRGRLAAIVASAAVVVAVMAAAFLLLPGPQSVGGRAGSGDARPPVELLALEHETREDSLAITGSVRNPADADAVHRLSVVATAFDEAGQLVASRRAPVAQAALPPGGTSQFALQVPAAGVSRYRISFLVDEDSIPHIDRRPANLSRSHQGASS